MWLMLKINKLIDYTRQTVVRHLTDKTDSCETLDTQDRQLWDTWHTRQTVVRHLTHTKIGRKRNRTGVGSVEPMNYSTFNYNFILLVIYLFLRFWIFFFFNYLFCTPSPHLSTNIVYSQILEVWRRHRRRRGRRRRRIKVHLKIHGTKLYYTYNHLKLLMIVCIVLIWFILSFLQESGILDATFKVSWKIKNKIIKLVLVKNQLFKQI